MHAQFVLVVMLGSIPMILCWQLSWHQTCLPWNLWTMEPCASSLPPYPHYQPKAVSSHMEHPTGFLFPLLDVVGISTLTLLAEQRHLMSLKSKEWLLFPSSRHQLRLFQAICVSSCPPSHQRPLIILIWQMYNRKISLWIIEGRLCLKGSSGDDAVGMKAEPDGRGFWNTN